MPNLNEQQEKAVMCNDSKIVCLAGAGSGKTLSLIERICRLVDDGVDPLSILVLTFTRAAAFEMRGRYFKRHLGDACPEFKTFHSFCYSLVLKDSVVRKAIGFSKVPAIADEPSVKKIEQMAQLQTKVKLSKSQLSGKYILTPKDKYEYELYIKAKERLMKSECVITFDDLSRLISDLFVKDVECIKKYKDQYKYVMVDEFQDTDDAQYEFVNSFKDSKLFVVGDALQAIYSFRGADSSIIKSLVDDSDWTTIKLYHNYRSCKCICEYANDNTHYSSPQHKVSLSTDKEGGSVNIFDLEYRIELDYEENQIYIQPCEIEFLLEYLPTLHGTTAILTRTNNECRAVIGVLKSANIKYVTSKRDVDTENILRSITDNDYLVQWVSMFLNSNQYAQYLRLSEIEPDFNIEQFYTTFANNKKIKYRMDTVLSIRKIFKKDESYIDKCFEILHLLGFDDASITGTLESNKDVLACVIEAVKQVSESDIYVGTIHSVKGLEYDNVILLGVNDTFYRLAGEDNLNLFYVGITRAKENLYVWKYKGDSII